MNTHFMPGSFVCNLTQKQRNSLVDIIKNSPDFTVERISDMTYRVHPKDYTGPKPMFAHDSAVAVFGHTYVPVFPKDVDLAFRYYLMPIWEAEDFTKVYHKKLKEIVELFPLMLGEMDTSKPN